MCFKKKYEIDNTGSVVRLNQFTKPVPIKSKFFPLSNPFSDIRMFILQQGFCLEIPGDDPSDGKFVNFQSKTSNWHEGVSL